MNEEHLSEEEIKEYVSYQVSLDREEQRKLIRLNIRVLDHIETCEECLGRVAKAQKERDTVDYEAIKSLRTRLEKRITLKEILETENGENVTRTDIDSAEKKIEEKIEEMLKKLRGHGEK